MKKVLVLTTVITLIGASHRCCGMEEETAFTRKLDITPLLSHQQIRESQEQILDSVNSQESDCTKKFHVIAPLSSQQILDSQEQNLGSQDVEVKREFETIPELTLQQIIATNEKSLLVEDSTRKQLEKVIHTLQQSEEFLLESHKENLQKEEVCALLIKAHDCLSTVLNETAHVKTREFSLSNNILRIILVNQLERQAQELKLLTEEIYHISPAELKNKSL